MADAFTAARKRQLARLGGAKAARPARSNSARQVARIPGRRGCPGDLTGLCDRPFRATGITAYLEAGGTLENAQLMAAHELPRTTKLYDRTGDEVTLDEVERIKI